MWSGVLAVNGEHARCGGAPRCYCGEGPWGHGAVVTTSWFKKVDHITYAVAGGTIERWADFHLRLGRGELVRRCDDVDPDSNVSSMKLWCIRYADFGVALVEGIDRDRESQVTSFVRSRGDHSTQHVAYAVDDLDAFIGHLRELGVRMRGDVVAREDAFGPVRQVFTKGFTKGDPAESSFLEFVERPTTRAGDAPVTFSTSAGKSFYGQIEDARAAGDDEPLVDVFCPLHPAHGGARR